MEAILRQSLALTRQPLQRHLDKTTIIPILIRGLCALPTDTTPVLIPVLQNNHDVGTTPSPPGTPRHHRQPSPNKPGHLASIPHLQSPAHPNDITALQKYKVCMEQHRHRFTFSPRIYPPVGHIDKTRIRATHHQLQFSKRRFQRRSNADRKCSSLPNQFTAHEKSLFAEALHKAGLSLAATSVDHWEWTLGKRRLENVITLLLWLCPKLVSLELGFDLLAEWVWHPSVYYQCVNRNDAEPSYCKPRRVALGTLREDDKSEDVWTRLGWV
jgi:hypothetical protein